MSSFRKNYSIQVWNQSRSMGDTAEIHILYVAAGCCSLRMRDRVIPLSRGDAFIVNYHQQAYADLSPNSLVAAVSLEYVPASGNREGTIYTGSR